MKKYNGKIIYAVMILLLTGFILGCPDTKDSTDTSNSFEVQSTGGSVTGIYKINTDGDDVYFETVNIKDSNGKATNYYTFEKNLDNPDTVYINVTASVLAVHSITILIYEDSALKIDYMVTQTDSTTEYISATKSYTFNQTSSTTTK